MKRVTGIGGVFFKAEDQTALAAWYREHLGIPVQDWGGAQFFWREDEAPARRGHTVWSLFKADTDYFAPSAKPFMVNFRVENLAALLERLRAEGCTVDERVEESEF